MTSERDDDGERGAGLMLGGLAGDVLGAAFEGECSATIKRVWAPPYDVFDRRQIPAAQAAAQLCGVDLGPSLVGEYTDDTEALLALAYSLTTLHGLNARHAALSWAWFWLQPKQSTFSSSSIIDQSIIDQSIIDQSIIDQSIIDQSIIDQSIIDQSKRDQSKKDQSTTGGYSAWTFAKLSALARGADYRHTGQLQTVGGVASDGGSGSWGNGGAMRIAPLGVAYRQLALLPDTDDDEAAVFAEASADPLYGVVAEALVATHTHAEAVDSATVVARAAAWLFSLAEPAAGSPTRLLGTLLRSAHTPAMRERLAHLLASLRACGCGERSCDVGASELRLHDSADDDDEDKRTLQQCCTPGKWFQIRSVDAVATALYFVAKYGGLGVARQRCLDARLAEACLIRCIAVGGDTDTVACMAGALLGALHGRAWIPDRWLATASQHPDYGVPAADRLGRSLAALSCRAVIPDTDPVAAAAADRLLDAMLGAELPVRHAY